jgi:uncharacterized membrane protein
MTYDPYDYDLDAKAAEVNAILERPYTVKINQYFDRSMEIFQPKAGELIGFTFLMIIISIGLSNIPYVGTFLDSIATAILSAGYYFFAFRFYKGQNAEFGDFFSGFRNSQFLPIFLVHLLMGLVLGGLGLVAFGLMVPIFYQPLSDLITFINEFDPSSSIPVLPELTVSPVLAALLLFLGLLFLIPILYLSICYTLAPLLVVDRRLGAWQAMETSRKLIHKKWLSWFGLMFLLGLIQLAGFFACGLGVLISIPVYYCALAAAYEDVVGLSQRNSLPEQPS